MSAPSQSLQVGSGLAFLALILFLIVYQYHNWPVALWTLGAVAYGYRLKDATTQP